MNKKKWILIGAIGGAFLVSTITPTAISIVRQNQISKLENNIQNVKDKAQQDFDKWKSDNARKIVDSEKLLFQLQQIKLDDYSKMRVNDIQIFNFSNESLIVKNWTTLINNINETKPKDIIVKNLEDKIIATFETPYIEYYEK